MVVLLRFEFPGATPAHVAFTSTADGNLALHVGDRQQEVLQRRRSLENRLGLAAGALRFMNQTHSVTVHSVDSSEQETSDGPTWGPDADALLSPNGSTPLAVMVADCLPVVFIATGGDGGLVTAVAHAGRHGLLGGILQNTVTAIREAAGESIHAWIGPSVCGSCYEVPAEMAAAAAEVMPGIESHTSWGTPSLDLPGAATMLLEGLGVDVTATGVCTVEDRNYYSYRRDARTGRLAGIVWPAPLLERNR
ncbi:polyphenol oxidase family protein [Arthrobacter rhombi]|uniref:polyphenol oxidase family protein n=1 Tax=Arthrobacter rhombi TaxID=71253 RepID=UPI003FD63075